MPQPTHATMPTASPQLFLWREVCQRYTDALLNLVYPPRCEGCDAPTGHHRTGEARWLCDSCLGSIISVEPPFCDVCGEPYDGAITSHFHCSNCSDTKLDFDFAIASVRAEGVTRELIHRFKYQRQMHLRGVLGVLLKKTLEDPRIQPWSKQALLVPIPLFHARQREREYNQAWELCREVSKSTAIPALQVLRRTRATTPQASLSRNQRRENLRHAFAMIPGLQRRSALRGRTVLLVDDVLTTGTTANECARILKRTAGVEKVVVITVARG